MAALIDSAQLEALEEAIALAFASGTHDHLTVLGYGEISSVVAWQGVAGTVACKRLPLFAGSEQFNRYRQCLEDYVAALRNRGVAVVPTEAHHLEMPDGQIAGYCVQPILPADSLGPKALAANEDRALALFDQLLGHIEACASDGLGLDGQLSNWSLGADARWSYLDISTPLMRDAEGREALDTDLFLQSLPWSLRPIVKRFMLGSILATYYQPRAIVVDFLANLHKERLAAFIPSFIERANQRLQPALSEDEVRRYYRDDARTWALLQRLRRMDRTWQKRVRRRPYPFLLPGRIER